MSGVARKTEVAPVDGTPAKRMFWSIISDYDLKTGICELVDNALDLWMLSGRRKVVRIAINLDIERQLISIHDNAGGVKQDDLRFLVAPGGSRNDPDAELIGIFGVGSKRAGVALGEQVVIRTRFRKERTREVDITREWLQSDDWEMPAYEVPDIEPGTTQVDVSHLRKAFSAQDVDDLCVHLGETYDWFLREGCIIEVNGNAVISRRFETWAFPPSFPPRSAAFEADLGKGEKISVEITAGLIRDRVPDDLENYGVYFYCNRRLIAKELKTREVGYITGQAGVPHSDASLCRAIVRLGGAAKLMPWNSSKSGINFGHPAFERVRPTLISLVTHFSSLSRRLRDDWDGKVFRHAGGDIEQISTEDVASGKRLILPPLPRVNKPRAEQLKSRNRARIDEQPWTLGLVEAMAAVDIVSRQHLETRNRIALILLDSNFEIALKEFIVHRSDLFPSHKYDDAHIGAIFKNRSNVIKEVSQKANIPKKDLDKARHYYGLRNKLIHERATAEVTDADVKTYRSTIEKVMKILFGLRF